MTMDQTAKRLEDIRASLRAENISYGELAELQGLAHYIEPGDTELLEPAGVPEFPEDDAEPPARVIFRVFRGHPREVIALFPDMPGTNDPGTCSSFVHNGQHGSVYLVSLMYSGTRNASPDEYACLKRELESPPYEYRLKVIRRTPKDSADIRTAEIRRTRS